MSAPRKAQLTGAVQWSDGSNFDGYLLLGLAIPTNGEGVWPTVALGSAFPRQRLPQWVLIPIKDGTFDATTKVFFNGDIEPRGCQYGAYWYDINGRKLAPAGAATAFDITTDPYVISVPTLTVPSAGSVPTP